MSMFIFAFINYLRVRFLLELNVDYPSFSNFFFKKSQITHFLLIKVMDYSPLVGVIFHNVHIHVYIHGRSLCYP